MRNGQAAGRGEGCGVGGGRLADEQEASGGEVRWEVPAYAVGVGGGDGRVPPLRCRPLLYLRDNAASGLSDYQAPSHNLRPSNLKVCSFVTYFLSIVIDVLQIWFVISL